jgi:CRISPR/Cas system-associated endonuclease/helicase Cas3
MENNDNIMKNNDDNMKNNDDIIKNNDDIIEHFENLSKKNIYNDEMVIKDENVKIVTKVDLIRPPIREFNRPHKNLTLYQE